jgi:hypothetical protein
MLSAIYEVSLCFLFIVSVIGILTAIIYGIGKLWQLIYCIYHARKDDKNDIERYFKQG